MEFDAKTEYPVISLMPDQENVENRGGTLRLGAYPCALNAQSKAYRIYGREIVQERHRHRYEFNNEYREAVEDAGMSLCGMSPDKRVVEMIELKEHPFFIGTQAHPEFRSRPNRAHPLFRGFVEAALNKSRSIAIGNLK